MQMKFYICKHCGNIITHLNDSGVRVVCCGEEMKELIFAWKTVKNVKSNAVVLSKNKGTIGIGMGQVNRIWAVEKAIEHAGQKVKGSVLASDAFFPFDDCVKALAKAGVTAIIQPGGSIRDEDSIKAADENNIAMVFTGMRHFKH